MNSTELNSTVAEPWSYHAGIVVPLLPVLKFLRVSI